MALGRENCLFVGSDCGGERAAAVRSLIRFAKPAGLDPELYLRSLLAQIANHAINRIEDLLPRNLATSLQTQSPGPPRHSRHLPNRKGSGLFKR